MNNNQAPQTPSDNPLLTHLANTHHSLKQISQQLETLSQRSEHIISAMKHVKVSLQNR